MSVHEFEDINDNHAWEAGQWYTIPIEGRNLTELTMDVLLPVDNGGTIEQSVDLIAAISPSPDTSASTQREVVTNKQQDRLTSHSKAIANGSVIRIIEFENGNNCTLNVEILDFTGETDENSGAAIYELIGNAKLVLSADVLVNYIDYESDSNRNVKKLISYLSQGGSYFPEATISKLIVHMDADSDNITQLTEIYEP